MDTPPPATEIPAAEAATVTLHYFYDDTSKCAGYLVRVPDACAEGMPQNMPRILASMWNSSRDKTHRINLLAMGVAQIEAHKPPAAPAKPRWQERLGRTLVGLFTEKGGAK